VLGWVRNDLVLASTRGQTARITHPYSNGWFAVLGEGLTPNQLRYDVRKLNCRALPKRDGSRYAYRLTTKGLGVSLLFLFFHKRLCGPSPTVASMIKPLSDIDPIAGSKRPITVPMQRSRKPPICLPSLGAAASPCCTRLVKHPSG